MSEPTSRRELNKARTRQALIDATRELGQQRGLENVTAEDIAERAGVSRRTFFNYFAGIEGVVAADLAAPLQRIAEVLHRRPADEQPITAIIAALREQPLGAEILLGWVPAARPSSAQGRELELRVWQHHEEWLVGVLQQRLGTEDDLRARSLAAAVMAIFEVVQKAWLPTAAELGAEEAVAAFNHELARVLGYAGDGWRHPRPDL
ncbi:helix-turn-helix domain-containing protein [Georgenia sp. MJ173]|uniref:TetR/AcrR family transcriptional regulator n=1 Tax=Georgenia sunbinii TaxID=3117728 RepID=UPI002F265B4A